MTNKRTDNYLTPEKYDELFEAIQIFTIIILRSIAGRSLIKKSKTQIRVLADPEEAEEARE